MLDALDLMSTARARVARVRDKCIVVRAQVLRVDALAVDRREDAEEHALYLEQHGLRVKAALPSFGARKAHERSKISNKLGGQLLGPASREFEGALDFFPLRVDGMRRRNRRDVRRERGESYLTLCNLI